jgi:hypothetical protein
VTAPTLGVLVPALSPTAWAVVVAVLLLVAVVTVVCVVRARRLDRLHRRTDAARAGLADALDRRGTVAVRVADALAGPRATGPGTPVLAADAPALRAAAHAALDACRTAADQAGLDPCEVTENTLTRRLAAVDRGRLPAGLAADLADAEQSVLIARRVHNDAVRDTLDLRSRRLVRWLRLAGTAPEPAYFEIADPPPWQAGGPAPALPGPAGTGTDAAG